MSVIPSACRWCDIPERDHVQRWHPERGWHGYEPPTRDLLHARMRARFTKKEN